MTLAAAHTDLFGAYGSSIIATSVLVRAIVGVVACATLAAVIGIARRDNSIADVFWGPLFVAGTLAGATAVPSTSVFQLGVMAMIVVWAGRLALHIGGRKRGEPEEDKRYAAWRAKWGARTWVLASLGKVYVMQAALALVVMTPVLVVLSAPDVARAWLAALGVVVFSVGLTVEAMADRQLKQFIARKRAGTEHASLCTDGLWGRSRHPNYFGEALLWFGVALYAAAAPYGWVGMLGAATIFTLVRYVSGVPLLEQQWKDRPGFAEWAETTPPFFPRLRRARPR